MLLLKYNYDLLARLDKHLFNNRNDIFQAWVDAPTRTPQKYDLAEKIAITIFWWLVLWYLILYKVFKWLITSI